jgi:hypothetical protein
MARIFEIAELEARKRALASESEVYRETLGLEIRNVRLSVDAFKRRFFGVRKLAGLLPFAAPVAGIWFGKRQSGSRSGLWRTALLAWQLYRRLAPVLGHATAGLWKKRAEKTGDRVSNAKPITVVK